MTPKKYPRLVVVHDRETGDQEKLRMNAGLHSPLSIFSFTDLREHNPFNDDLASEADHADTLLVQSCLTAPLSQDAFQSIGSAIFSSAKLVQVGLFDNSYNISWPSFSELMAIGDTTKVMEDLS